MSPRDRVPPIQPGEYEKRRLALGDAIRRAGASGLLLGPGASLTYFTGVSWKPSERFFGCAISDDGAVRFICPAFEEPRLRGLFRGNGPSDVATWEEDQSPFELVAEQLPATGSNTVLLDPALPAAFVFALRDAAPAARFASGQAAIEAQRRIKSPAERALIEAAMQITLSVHRSVHRSLAAGVDTASVKAEIDRLHRERGADAGSTFCIVSFGPTTAIAHGSPDVQRLEAGQWVLIDTGCTLHGYHSDLTRTYVFGEPTDRQRELWSLERQAQLAGFEAARPGSVCSAIDSAARGVLERAGFGPGYRLPGLPHRTGHGIGLELHESPYFVRGSSDRLEPGVCGSIEPMLAVPGEAGVRLEDHFYMTDHGPKWFTTPSRSLEEPFAEE
ncbi:MAG: Xaa-Pro peptidase family protein [Planctomycetota bacterium]